MKTRRMHITKEQGETIKLALVCGIDEIERILSKENTAYWKMLLCKMQNLKTELEEYKWEID